MRRAVIFDAYGTLFDVAGAARAAAAGPDGADLAAIWPRLAEDWRRKQLEYTWLRSLMRDHADFRRVTADALHWALDAQNLDDSHHARLMALYDRLPAYPEAAAALTALRAKGVRTAILSNGTPAMLEAATVSAGLSDLLDAVISVEEAGVYKPDPRTYALVQARLGVAPAEVLFVSSNGWDIAGAAAFGFATVWVNRANLPTDRLGAAPGRIVADLSEMATRA
jgi:2-haloacid dehalogenase